MSVSAELLCSFELLKPLDSSALKSHIKKGRTKRQNMLNSPVCFTITSLLASLLIHCCSLQVSLHTIRINLGFLFALLSSTNRSGITALLSQSAG